MTYRHPGVSAVRTNAAAETGDGPTTTDRSVVNKVIDFTDSSEMFALTSPHQEVTAYISGLLDSLQGPHASGPRFRAARCCGLAEVGADISGEAETVAIDWQLIGYAALGMDVDQEARLEPENTENHLAWLADMA